MFLTYDFVFVCFVLTGYCISRMIGEIISEWLIECVEWCYRYFSMFIWQSANVWAGYFAFRGRYGTPFIRAVCDMLHEHHTSLDLMHILTRVCYDVAFFFESLVSRTNPDHVILSYKKQMPTIVSMLTKDVYFVPKLPPPMQDKQQDDVQWKSDWSKNCGKQREIWNLTTFTFYNFSSP